MANITSSVIEFDNVSKAFRLHRDRTEPFWQLFVQRLRRNQQDLHQFNDSIFWALRDVSFTVPHGSTVGLIGANGAGKSTTLKLISRIIQPTSGSVKVKGRVTALLELGAGFHPELSGRDNIYLNGAIMGLTRKEIDYLFDQIVEFAELEDFIDVPVKDYSSGMYTRLGFSVAAHLNPEILLLDEVFAVGDQAFQQKSLERIHELRRRGIMIIFVSHSMEAVLQICDYGIWLEHGRLRASGDVAAVSAAYYEDTIIKIAAKQKVKSPIVHKPAKQGQHHGSGEARIDDIEFVDADGRRTRFTYTNCQLTIRLHYIAYERIEQPMIGIAFFQAEKHIRLAGPNNTMQPYRIPFIEGQGYVDYTIERLRFLPGDYILDASIYDWEDTHCYDYWNDCARLTVLPGKTREKYGLIALEGTWHGPYTESPSAPESYDDISDV